MEPSLRLLPGAAGTVHFSVCLGGLTPAFSHTASLRAVQL